MMLCITLVYMLILQRLTSHTILKMCSYNARNPPFLFLVFNDHLNSLRIRMFFDTRSLRFIADVSSTCSWPKIIGLVMSLHLRLICLCSIFPVRKTHLLRTSQKTAFNTGILPIEFLQKTGILPIEFL